MRNLRKFTWFILIINALFLIWVISIGAGASGTPEECAGKVGDSLDFCNDLYDVGSSIAIGVVIVFWAAVDVVLGILWLVTNKKQRTCPACGKPAKQGLTVCRHCAYDFAAAAGHGHRSNDPPPAPS